MKANVFKKNNISSYHLLIILILLFLLVIYISFKFTLLDKTPLIWDSGTHIMISIHFYDTLKHGEFQKYFLEYTHYPPYIYWIYSLFILITGYSNYTSITFNIFLLIILICSVFYFTKTNTSTYAALLCSIYALGLIFHLIVPGSFLFYMFMLDFPLIITTYIAYNFIIKGIRTSSFSLKTSFLIGIFTGVALLTKWTSVIMLFLPLLWYIRTAIIKKRYLSLYLLFICIFCEAGWWYIYHYQNIINDLHAWLAIKIISYYELQDRTIYLQILLLILISFTSFRKNCINLIQYRLKMIIKRILYDITTWEICNCIIAFTIFYLLPVYDYRFIMFILFIFCTIIFHRITLNTKNINFKILSVGVVIYALIIIIIKQPTISKANYAINTIRNFTLTHQNSSFAIYFEDEIYTFNMPGIRVMFQEYSIFKNIFIDYQFINSGPSSHLQDCIIPEFQKDWLLVFTANPEKRNGKTYNNFIKECPSEFRQKYEYQQTEEAFDGKTQIFKRIVDKNSKTNK